MAYLFGASGPLFHCYGAHFQDIVPLHHVALIMLMTEGPVVPCHYVHINSEMRRITIGLYVHLVSIHSKCNLG